MKDYTFDIRNSRLAACTLIHINEIDDDWARIKGREIASALADGSVMRITTPDELGVPTLVAEYKL